MDERENVRYEKHGHLGLITMNRPKALNALNSRTLAELDQVLDIISGDQEIKVVVITGAGRKAFVAGADITEMMPKTALEARSFAKFGQSVFNKLENLPQPVIAAVNGFALGGGCELAMACDIRIASELAKFGQPETGLGITPGFAGTQRLARLIGKGRAKELIYTADIIDADEAFRIGLVNEVVSADQLIEAAGTLAHKIMSRSAVAVQMSKAAINEGLDADFETGQAYEAEVFGLCFANDDQKEGMKAFIEKRPCVFLRA